LTFSNGRNPDPPEIKNVALVYRNFKYPGDTLQHYYKSDYQLKKASASPNLTDSMLVNICLQELSENLNGNHAFNRVEFSPSPYSKITRGKNCRRSISAL
jgi:hypothetical protein